MNKLKIWNFSCTISSNPDISNVQCIHTERFGKIRTCRKRKRNMTQNECFARRSLNSESLLWCRCAYWFWPRCHPRTNSPRNWNLVNRAATSPLTSGEERCLAATLRLSWPCVRAEFFWGCRGVCLRIIPLIVHNVPQNFLIGLSGDPQALWEKEGGHEGPLVRDDLKDHDVGRKLGLLHDKVFFNFLADLPVVLFVTLLLLVKVLFIREAREHSGGPVLDLSEPSRWLDLS